MRALAMTGIVTASWISRILSGSAMRATPPSRRMSAGTRSSAMTATAPASSAIRACSAVVTSMITPPFSISARPLFTRIVPMSAIGEILAAEDEVIRSPPRHGHGVAVQPIPADDEVEEALLDPPSQPAGVAGRACGEVVVLRRVAPAVDDVPHAAARGEALVVVVVAAENEPDAMALEVRHPLLHDLGVGTVGATRESGMVEGGNAPACARARKRPPKPCRLLRVDAVRVEQVELDRSECAPVVAPRHAELVEDVPATVELD